VEIVSLRFANALNPEEPAPLARYFDLPVVPTVIGYDPVLQVVHRDDCIQALIKATLGRARGAYNIAGANGLPLSALLDGTGKVHAPLLPPAGAMLLSPLLTRLGIASLTPQLLDLLRWGRTLNVSSAQREQRRVLQFLPEGHAYLYERELEEYIHHRRVRRRAGNGARLKLAPEPGAEPSAPPRPRRR